MAAPSLGHLPLVKVAPRAGWSEPAEEAARERPADDGPGQCAEEEQAGDDGQGQAAQPEREPVGGPLALQDKGQGEHGVSEEEHGDQAGAGDRRLHGQADDTRQGQPDQREDDDAVGDEETHAVGHAADGGGHRGMVPEDLDRPAGTDAVGTDPWAPPYSAGWPPIRSPWG